MIFFQKWKSNLLYKIQFPLLRMPGNSIKSIIIGERMESEEQKAISNILRLNEYKHVLVFKKIRDKYNPRHYKYKLQKK